MEFASAVAAAVRARTIRDFRTMIARFDADCATGSIGLLRLDTTVVLPMARQLVTEHSVHTLDAIHLAVALTRATDLAAGGRSWWSLGTGRRRSPRRSLDSPCFKDDGRCRPGR